MALTDGQRRCVETLDRPLVVAAGAGSGKTFTLTKRIAGAFEGGSGKAPYVTDIDEICAITFTKKAAGELKSRIKAELRARNMVDQALRVDEAWISTIHGMCARILRAHAVQLGLDPAFEVVEGAQLEDYRDRAIDAVLAEAECEDSPRLDALFGEFKVRSSGGNDASVEDMLKSLVGAASAQANGADSIVMPGVTMPPALAVEQAIELVEGVMAAAVGEGESKSKAAWMQEAAEALENAHAAMSRGIDDYGAALRAIGQLRLAKNFGSADFRARVGEARGQLAACIMEARLGAARAHLETLSWLTRRALDKFTALKRADGVLDNNDLLVLAARAIEENPDIAARYADKFKLVMVDEFQDTDQMQVDMIKRLSGEEARRLCTVGDAQQSIYRFRGADVSVYRRHVEWLRADWPESVIELAANFRSHPDVLAFVDRVFEKPDMFGSAFMSLAAKRDEDEVAKPFSTGRPRIVVQHTTCPSRGYTGTPAVEVAAGRIADEFAALAQAGHDPGEMVVLLRRLTKADVYAQALRDRGLPCIIAGGSVFASMPETLMMEQLARVLANPLETQSLFNVLTSPLFSLTAGDLLAVGGVEGFRRAALGKGAERTASPQLACALRVMGQTFAQVGDVPVARIMSRVVCDSGWLSRRQSGGAEGLASAANALKAIRLVDAIERSGAMGPASVARRFSDMLALSKEAPGALSVAGGDSVRIMTIHASKGLEFPIVAVGELVEGRPSSRPLLVSSVEGSVFASLDVGRSASECGKGLDADARALMRDYVLGDVAGEDELARAVAEDAGALHRRLALQEHEAAGDGEEAKRLLYVALTRAKEALVISSTGTRTKDNPNGIPKGVLAGVFTALDPTGDGFEAGRSTFDFGGSMPAVLECVALESDDAPTSQEREGGQAGDPAGSQAADRPLFMVPAAEEPPALACEPYRPAHEGVFSYSSISDASHKGDLLDRLAEAFAVPADAAADGVDAGAGWPLAAKPFAGTLAGRLPAMAGGQPAFATDFDDGFWDFDVSGAFDEDRATDLGTAFHRLAQFAVVSRTGNGPLVSPPADRVEALARTCNLDGEQRLRLCGALDRWFASDIARDMAALPSLSAEVPFFVAVPGGEAAQAYLEGEIDLLGFDEGRSRAFVVDYKTGGHADESPDDLRRKHVLQAACYAYAILLQGADSVDAAFVRVERGRADDPAQPQCVRYRFTSDGIAQLADAIAAAHALA